MERPIFYERAQAVPIRARTVPVAGSSAVAPECLFEDDQIPVFHVAGRKNSDILMIPDDSRVGLYTISDVHGRSYELDLRGMGGVGAWADENGILFSSYSIKGNNVDNPYVWPSDIMPEKYATQGLQDSGFIRRTVVASQVLRKLGIEAEMTTRIIEPLTLPVDGQEMTVEQFKDELLRRTIARKGKVDQLKAMIDPRGRKTTREMGGFINNADFRFSVRAMQVPERMSDLSEFETKGELLVVLGRAFNFINFSERLKSEQYPDYEADYFDVNNPDDIVRYFGTYLPTKIGRYFTTMHKNGLVHQFPHPGNISLVGSIYDLDSVKGANLGLGDKVDWIDYQKDHLQLFFHDDRTLTNPHFLDVLGMDAEKINELQRAHANTILKSYLEGFGPDVNGRLVKALEKLLIKTLTSELYSETAESWIKQMVKSQGVTYPNIDETYESMLGAYEEYYSEPDREFKYGFDELVVFATVATAYMIGDTHYPTKFMRSLAVVGCSSGLLLRAMKDNERVRVINERIKKAQKKRRKR